MILIIVTIIFFVVVKMYIKSSKNSVVKDIEKDINIVKFEQEAQLDNMPKDNNYGHETGNGVIVNLINRTEFLEGVNNLDYGLSITNALYEGLNYINIISEYDGSSINEYYYNNEEVINTLYGIKDIDTFTKFFYDLGNEKILECKIIMDSLVENDDIYKFNIELSGNNKVIIPVKALANSDDMIARIYFYD